MKSVKKDLKKEIASIENIRDLEIFLRYSGMSKKIAVTLASRSRDIFQGEPDNLNHDKDKSSNSLLSRLKHYLKLTKDSK